MTAAESRCLSDGYVGGGASFADSHALMVCHYTLAACSCSMVMAQFHEMFLAGLRRSASGCQRTIAVRCGPIADDFGLADGTRPGLVTRRRTIT